MAHILGTWEIYTIKFDAPPHYNQDHEKRMMEITDKFEHELAELVKKFNRNKEGLMIEAQDSEGQTIE